ncbi:hypothetical protein SDC9_141726 [bioreactor metagenome]|uniref:Uncharacterized protein n=1 Tax=bioreactor metagenome TaxID=1076179 RepID=A0A645DYH7_9ZZZZ
MPERGDGPLHGFGLRVAKVEADTIVEFFLCRKDRPRRDADSLIQRHAVQLERIDGLRQFQPHEIAASRSGQAGGAGKETRDPFNQ